MNEEQCNKEEEKTNELKKIKKLEKQTCFLLAVATVSLLVGSLAEAEEGAGGAGTLCFIKRVYILEMHVRISSSCEH